MKNRKYQIAGHLFEVSGERLCAAVACIGGFKPFEVSTGEGEFLFREGAFEEIPSGISVQYTFEYEDVIGSFIRTAEGYRLSLKPMYEDAFEMWCREGEKVMSMYGNWSVRLYRFALWLGFGIMTLSRDTLAVHSSCIVYRGKAVLFLGESGTGKSTHTRLWREHIPGAVLLNDDSPMIRVEDGKVWAYGSAWSGKTPCYKNEVMPLKAVVRLSQAPYNKIEQYMPLRAYASLMPACSCMRWDRRSTDALHRTVEKVIKVVKGWHLECLPDADAAYVCNSAVTK